MLLVMSNPVIVSTYMYPKCQPNILITHCFNGEYDCWSWQNVQLSHVFFSDAVAGSSNIRLMVIGNLVVWAGGQQLCFTCVYKYCIYIYINLWTKFNQYILLCRISILRTLVTCRCVLGEWIVHQDLIHVDELLGELCSNQGEWIVYPNSSPTISLINIHLSTLSSFWFLLFSFSLKFCSSSACSYWSRTWKI